MKKNIRYILFSLGMLLGTLYSSFAQTGVGSTTADNSSVVIAPETVELRYSETSYFGPNAHWEINGTLEIWSKNIWIAPTATFTGTGRIIIHNPGENPFYEDMTAGPTQIDGNNGNFIGLTIELRNPNNLLLANIEDPGYGTNNPTGALAAALNIGGIFEFAVDGGDVLLNGHDFGIGPDGQLIDYNSNRMIVTGNSIAGHVVKTYRGTAPFVFPIGIAEGDYTPATLSPANATKLHVSIQDYNAATVLVPNPEAGMDRIWHIYADGGVNTTYTLQHNSITNGSAYVDETAQIVQYAGSGNWIGDATVRVSEGVHTRESILTVAGAIMDGSWFTKLSEVITDEGPNAQDDYTSVGSGLSVEVLVLENDVPGSSPIVVSSVRIVMQPENGTVALNPRGSITYIPNSGFVGEDLFVYEITDENGYTDTATVWITVYEAENLLIPNALTPNSDGKNDLFVIQGLENYENADLTIFNRWGNEVYRSRNYQQNWDGAGVSDGTYYYRLVLKRSGIETIHKGWVLVKR